MWAQKDNQFDIDWQEAQHWVRLSFPDSLSVKHKGWRLPTTAELIGLSLIVPSSQCKVSLCGHKVCLPQAIDLSCGWVWSSERRSITARVYNFHRGYAYWDRRSKKRGFRVLPVRSIE